MAALFWMVVLGFAGMVWAATLLGFLLSRRSQNRGWRVTGALPFALVTTVGLIGAGAFGWTMLSHDNPRTVWNEEFGFAPPADVRGLNSSYYYFGDTGLTYLRFQCNAATVQRIANVQKLTVVPRHSDSFSVPDSPDPDLDSDMPAWWKPKASPTLRLWHRNSHDDFATENTDLYFDSQTGWAHYSFEGID